MLHTSWFPVVKLKLDGTQIAAGEAKNPRRSLPKAIRGVYIRILLYEASNPYPCAVLIVGVGSIFVASLSSVSWSPPTPLDSTSLRGLLPHPLSSLPLRRRELRVYRL